MAGRAGVGESVLDWTRGKGTEAPPNIVEIIESLVAQHSLLVFRIAYAILRNHHDAEDAVQECFLRVLKAAKRLPHVRNSKTWVARIAWTTALDRQARRNVFSRKEHPLDEQALAHLVDGKIAVDEQLVEEEMQHLLERLIASLPNELRGTLELSTVQELNSAEIAEVMNIPEGSVRTRLLRARRMLKEKLTALEVRRSDD